MFEEEIKYFYNIYVLGKDTPNKLKLSQMLGKRVSGYGNSERIKEKHNTKYTIRNVPEESEDEIIKDEDVFYVSHNYFFYVYNVDDRETFEKFEEIHQKLKEKFNNKDNDIFVLYGINSNIEHERSVSQEELIKTAFKNESFYFELQEFNMEWIPIQINYIYGVTNKIIYVSGSYDFEHGEFLNEYLKKFTYFGFGIRAFPILEKITII